LTAGEAFFMDRLAAGRSESRPDREGAVMESGKSKKSDIEHLCWAVEQRAEIQRTLLALLEYVRGHKQTAADFVPNYLVNHLIGAAFSLWRAVFLAETYRTEESIRDKQEAFLTKVVSDNAITFGDDKMNRDWTFGYYVDDAKLRIERASSFADHHLKSDTRRLILPKLRLVGFRGVPLTEFEWESTHYGLRLLLGKLDPSTKVKPVEPQGPRPEGLEKILLDEDGKEAE
jgi:hypothetical protein